MSDACEIQLERRFFAINAAGDNEFDWLLDKLAIPEQRRAEVDTVSFKVDLDSVIAE